MEQLGNKKLQSTILNEPPHDKTNEMACAPNEDSDQPGHSPSLIRVFVGPVKKPWVLSYPLSAQRRFWSDWADVQADLNLRWVHSHFVGFVVRRLKYHEKKIKLTCASLDENFRNKIIGTRSQAHAQRGSGRGAQAHTLKFAHPFSKVCIQPASFLTEISGTQLLEQSIISIFWNLQCVGKYYITKADHSHI